MDAPDHILIVDDDAEIRSLLSQYLVNNGLRVTAVADGRGMWQALDAGRIDLIVLDLMLPGDDGLTLCRNLRAKSDTPVIMLTARGEETDRIVGLEMGADDYLAKPFSARELLARIKAILRRARSLPENLQADSARHIRFAGWVLDTAHRQLVSAANVVTPLSGAEYRLAADLPQPPESRAQSRPAARPHAGQGSRPARPQHRRAGEPPAASARRRSARAAPDQDGARGRLRARGERDGNAVTRLLPRSLFGRLMLVLASGLVVAQLLSAAINLVERDSRASARERHAAGAADRRHRHAARFAGPGRAGRASSAS